MFHVLGNAMGEASGPTGSNIKPILAAAAGQMVAIVKELRVVNWAENVDVQNAMRNRMDDYFFDIIRDEHGIEVAPEQIDAIVDSVLKVARARMAV